MHHSSTLDVGRDVHKDSIAVADVANEHDAEVIYLSTMGTRPCDIDHLVRTRPAHATHWLRLCPCTKAIKPQADLTQLRPTLDIGSHINARHEPLPELGATQERTLEAVGSMPLFGLVTPPA
ncbi:MAG: hypothetical protein ACRERE_13400 [Candidatus Entotheonellia bacterium]